jgi:PAS domain S-box-containing protein
MKTPRLTLSVFRSRLGKRLFWTFVGCSFLPIIILSALSYRHVEQQLRDQTATRLKQTTKGVGLSIYERLELLEAEMQLIAQALPKNRPVPPRVIELPRTGSELLRLDGLQLVTADSRRIALQGRIANPPAFTASEKARLGNGQSLLQVIPREDLPARILMSIRAPGDPAAAEILTAELNPAFLWGIGQQYNLPPFTELTVMVPSGQVLISSLSETAPLFLQVFPPQRDTTSHRFVWRSGDQEYMASYWDLFLKSRFGAEPWTIVLSRTRADALAPLRSFKVNFPLVLLVGFWMILLVSIRFIRKSLDPLQKLRGATQRIHDGDFSQAVTVDSNDEFEDLATSFNVMTAKLARTFGELSVMAHMGHFVTSRPGVVDLVTTELEIMHDRLHFDWGLLMVEGSLLGGAPVIAGYGLPRSLVLGSQTVALIDNQSPLHSALIPVLQLREIVLTNQAHEQPSTLPPACLAFLKRIRGRSLLCVPISFETTHMGVLAVGNRAGAQALSESDQQLLIGIAGQTAVAINGLVSIQQLEASEARFREAFDHAATGIALVSADQRIQASNRYLQQMLGYTEDELAQKTLADITLPEDRAIGEDELALMIAGRQAVVQVENRLRHKNREAVWARMIASLLRDKQGRPNQLIFHIRDLTAEKAAEADKHRLEGQLRQAQKMEAIGTLAGGIAHDFNNILSAVGGFTELALMKLPQDAEASKDLEKVKAAAERATDLVRQILAFSRQSENEKIPLQISSIVKEALQLMRASLPATIEIRKSIDNTPESIMADPTQIHQIVMNLCTNAMHAMQTEGGVLEVGLTRVSLAAEEASAKNLAAPGDYLRLTVADTGCGMDTRTRERIFDPYFTTKSKGKGTGLGLAVVHGIVDSHGGAIEVSTTPGEGTRFDVYFPIAASRSLQTEATPAEDLRGQERILFVDDEPMLVDLVRTMLAKQGYRVTGLTDPLEALAAFRDAPQQFDIVITDLTMPGMTGDRLAEAIAAIRPDLPILLCSGYMKHGDHPCLAGSIPKPIRMQQLSRSVRQALDRTRRPPSDAAAL